MATTLIKNPDDRRPIAARIREKLSDRKHTDSTVLIAADRQR